VKNFEKVISMKKRSVSKKDQFQKKISMKKTLVFPSSSKFLPLEKSVKF